MYDDCPSNSLGTGDDGRYMNGDRTSNNEGGGGKKCKNDSSALSIKEYSDRLKKLEKENFDLKLRIYSMEEIGFGNAAAEPQQPNGYAQNSVCLECQRYQDEVVEFQNEIEAKQAQLDKQAISLVRMEKRANIAEQQQSHLERLSKKLISQLEVFQYEKDERDAQEFATFGVQTALSCFQSETAETQTDVTHSDGNSMTMDAFTQYEHETRNIDIQCSATMVSTAMSTADDSRTMAIACQTDVSCEDAVMQTESDSESDGSDQRASGALQQRNKLILGLARRQRKKHQREQARRAAFARLDEARERIIAEATRQSQEYDEKTRRLEEKLALSHETCVRLKKRMEACGTDARNQAVTIDELQTRLTAMVRAETRRRERRQARGVQTDDDDTNASVLPSLASCEALVQTAFENTKWAVSCQTHSSETISTRVQTDYKPFAEMCTQTNVAIAFSKSSQTYDANAGVVKPFVVSKRSIAVQTIFTHEEHLNDSMASNDLDDNQSTCSTTWRGSLEDKKALLASLHNVRKRYIHFKSAVVLMLQTSMLTPDPNDADAAVKAFGRLAASDPSIALILKQCIVKTQLNQSRNRQEAMTVAKENSSSGRRSGVDVAVGENTRRSSVKSASSHGTSTDDVVVIKQNGDVNTNGNNNTNTNNNNSNKIDKKNRTKLRAATEAELERCTALTKRMLDMAVTLSGDARHARSKTLVDCCRSCAERLEPFFDATAGKVEQLYDFLADSLDTFSLTLATSTNKDKSSSCGCKVKVDELEAQLTAYRKKYDAAATLCRSTKDRLDFSNQVKRSLEKTVVSQLARTEGILSRARSNLQLQTATAPTLKRAAMQLQAAAANAGDSSNGGNIRNHSALTALPPPPTSSAAQIKAMSAGGGGRYASAHDLSAVRAAVAIGAPRPTFALHSSSTSHVTSNDNARR